MNEAAYQAGYRQLHAFTNCEAQATYRITNDTDIAKVPNGLPCYYTDGSSLFLCEDCLKFSNSGRIAGGQVTALRGKWLSFYGRAGRAVVSEARHYECTHLHRF